MIAPFVTIVAGVLVYLIWPAAGLTQWGLFGLAAWPLAIRPLELSRAATGRELIPVLVGTAKLHAATGALLALGFVLSRTVS